MPFDNLRIDINPLLIREPQIIENVMAEVIVGCNRYERRYIAITNSMRIDPSRRKLNRKVLVFYHGLKAVVCFGTHQELSVLECHQEKYSLEVWMLKELPHLKRCGFLSSSLT